MSPDRHSKRPSTSCRRSPHIGQNRGMFSNLSLTRAPDHAQHDDASISKRGHRSLDHFVIGEAQLAEMA